MKLLIPFVLLLLLLLLAACGGSGGDSSTPQNPPPVERVNFVASAPSDLYFNQHDTIDVTITNEGTASAYAPIRVTMDGSVVAAPIVPTLAPGEVYNWSFPIWAAQDLTVDHVFHLSSGSWTYSTTIHYHAISGG